MKSITLSIILFFTLSLCIAQNEKFSLEVRDRIDRPDKKWIVIVDDQVVTDTLIGTYGTIGSYIFISKNEVCWISDGGPQKWYKHRKKLSNGQWWIIESIPLPCFVPRSFDLRPHFYERFELRNCGEIYKYSSTDINALDTAKPERVDIKEIDGRRMGFRTDSTGAVYQYFGKEKGREHIGSRKLRKE